MAVAAVRESATFACGADQVREARVLVGGVLGPSHPCGDVAVLLASEMVTNCVLHGGSAGPGEAVTVTVVVGTLGCGSRSPVARRKAFRFCGGRTTRLRAAGGCGWWRSWPSGGLQTGRRAGDDLVRATAQLTLAPAMYLPWTWLVPRRRRIPMLACCGAGSRGEVSVQVHGRSVTGTSGPVWGPRQVHGCEPARAGR
jgi:hypothetical protein